MKPNQELSFEDFKNLAKDKTLTEYEKIGFPNSYRKGKSNLIVSDINSKIPLLSTKNKTIIDIGCGCSDLVKELIKICKKNQHKLILVDSEEMLSLIPDTPEVIKINGYFPEISDLFDKYYGKIDYVLTYSVLHYIYIEGNIFKFIHRALDLLREGGYLLIGDIPNINKRSRFLTSREGIKFLKNKEKFDKNNKKKGLVSNNDLEQKIDDSLILSILSRYRNYGYETYLLPQKNDLPMANRREDILIVKR
ncbi:MAG: class I SAM-dependent methyltransferase [Actinobacteria bacterium]|nr:class I SAM-dependent methyltransferase [Actinomycetota bacterium]